MADGLADSDSPLDAQARDLETLAWLNERQAQANERYMNAQRRQRHANGWVSRILAYGAGWMAEHLVAARAKVYRDAMLRATAETRERHYVHFPDQRAAWDGLLDDAANIPRA